MRLIANRQLTGDYGTVVAGQEFEASEQIAARLLSMNVAHRATAPRIEYDTKVIVPAAPEVSARQPFRDLPVPDEESPEMAASGDRVLRDTDLSASRATDFSGRGGRPRPSARRA